MTNFENWLYSPFDEGPDYSEYVVGPTMRYLSGAASSLKRKHNAAMHDLDVRAAKCAVDNGCPIYKAARTLFEIDNTDSFFDWCEEGDTHEDDDVVVAWMHHEFRRLGLVEKGEVMA